MRTSYPRQPPAKRFRPTPRRSGGGFFGFLMFLVFFGFLGGSAWLYFHLLDLEKTIIREFERERRWAIPARVFARPLELYPGLTISQNALLQELRAGRYREDSKLTSEGSFVSKGNRVELRTRRFVFSDGESPSQRLTITFQDGKIFSIENNKSQTLPLVRLDPVLIGSFFPQHNQDRELVRLADVPKSLVALLLATEDRRFYEHQGIDFQSIIRALIANIKAGRTVQGGSTLTQQLVKNYFLNSDRTLIRKINEALMAWLLERRHSKEAILEAYLNEIYLGQDGSRAIHGFGLASQFYFDKRLQDLTLSEMALLVGLAKGASYFDPRKHPERALRRRNAVLDNALEHPIEGIDAKAIEAAKAAPLGVTAKPARGQTDFPAYFDLVQRQLKRDYPEEVLRTEGLRIFTAMDPQWQFLAEKAVQEILPTIEKNQRLEPNTLQAAVVMADILTGELRALVSDREPSFPGFNRALDAERQIGSTIKPFVYLAAMLYADYHPVTLLRDSELVLDVGSRQLWRPENYDKKFRGALPLFQALAESTNIPAVRAGLAAGIERVIDVLKKSGIFRSITPYPALFLGALDTTPLELTQAYQTLAAQGFYVPLRAIREVLSEDGKRLSSYPIRMEQVFDSNAVAPLLDLLPLVIQEGTARSAAKSFTGVRVGGKTGTTNELRDSWFVGFSAETLTTVWVGRDDNQPTRLTGATGALRIWEGIMKNLPLTSIQIAPNGEVEYFWADPKTGLLATPNCAGARRFLFYKNTMPETLSPACSP